MRFKGKHLITTHVLFLSSCEWPSCPWKLQTPILLLNWGCHMYLIFPSCLWPSHVWDSCNYKIKFYFLPLICLMSIYFIGQPEESRRVRESFLPPWHLNDPIVMSHSNNSWITRCFLGFHIGLELHCWLSWPLACRLQFVGPLSLHNHMS